MSTTRVECVAPTPHLAAPTARDSYIPGTSPAELRQAFEALIPIWAGTEDAEAYYQQVAHDYNSGAIFTPLPPRGTCLNHVVIGKLAVFYHPTWPEAPKHQHFTWNFYIGAAGRGPESIFVDWLKEGVVVKMLGWTGKWEDCLAPTTGPRTRVQISYSDDASGSTTHELVFPPDPRESPVPVRLLQWPQ